MEDLSNNDFAKFDQFNHSKNFNNVTFNELNNQKTPLNANNVNISRSL
jgi:hypothetical protein